MDGAAFVLVLAGAMLGHESFAVRQQAHAFLEKVDLAEAHLRFLEQGIDPEVSHRATRALRPIWERRAARLEKVDRATLPWIDMLPFNVEFRDLNIRTHLDAARDKVAVSSGGWPTYREATRSLVQALLSSGVREEQIEELLAGMREREREYRIKNRYAGP